jgi:hypothetical protein
MRLTLWCPELWVAWFCGVGATLRGHATLIVARREEPDVSNSAPEQRPCGDFVATEELIRRQGTRPLRLEDDLAAEDPFASDEEYAEFLADLYASRRAGS